MSNRVTIRTITLPAPANRSPAKCKMKNVNCKLQNRAIARERRVRLPAAFARKGLVGTRGRPRRFSILHSSFCILNFAICIFHFFLPPRPGFLA